MPIFRLAEEHTFPPPELAEPNGLLAVGGDLQPARLVAAYRLGIFPWYSDHQPILWWFPTPRLVLYPSELHISRRLARTIRQAPFDLAFDTAMADVIAACAGSRRSTGNGTWITTEMAAAYTALHHLGYAHSVECRQNGRLVGGLYGIRLDRVFFGESMFTKETDASKIALVTLSNHLIELGVELIDCQMTTPHLQRLGAKEISGKTFQQHLRQLIQITDPDGKWIYEKDSDQTL